jgi:hypothetical protein
MPQKPRPHRIQVKLNLHEYEALTAKAVALGTTKSRVVRDALTSAMKVDVKSARAEPTRVEALELLLAHARDGSAVAAAALARELRLEPVETGRSPAGVGTVRIRDLRPGALRLAE